MLPILKKSTPQEYQTSEIKLYHPPRELNNIENENERKSSFMGSSRGNSKIRVKAGGFRKDESSLDYAKTTFGMKSSLPEQNYATLNNQPQFINKSMAFAKLNSNKDLSAEIKLIEKKIRYHKKKLEEEKRKKEEEEKTKNDPYSQDFDKIIRKEMEMQGYNTHQNENENKGFDYLTNPGKLHNEEPEEEEIVVHESEPIFIEEKKFDLSEKIEKLEKHYENNLKKKFERREMFPHYPCKRKTPKLCVTAKTNALEKYGKKPAQEEHIFRVLTKECTPQEIYPTIPNFAIVKDNLSKNVLAYLTDFKPFIDKTKEGIYDDEPNARQHEKKEEKEETLNKNGKSQEVIYKEDRKSAQESRA